MTRDQESRWYRQTENDLYDEWFFYLTAEQSLAWMYLKSYVGASCMSQKSLGRAPALSCRVAASRWGHSITPDDVETMIRAAVDAGQLRVEGGRWHVLDLRLYASEKTLKRMADKGDPAMAPSEDAHTVRESGDLSDKRGQTTPNEDEPGQTRTPSSRDDHHYDHDNDPPTEDKGAASAAIEITAEPHDPLCAMSREPETSKPMSSIVYERLPESHRIPAVQAALVEYFKMRGEKKWKRWPPSTINRNIREFSEAAPQELVKALNKSVRNAWQGVFFNADAPEVAPAPSEVKTTADRASDRSEKIIAAMAARSVSGG